MTRLAFSQAGYPMKVIIDGDTCTVIDQEQTRIINKMYLRLVQCRADRIGIRTLVDSLEKQVEVKDEEGMNLAAQVSNCDSAVNVYKGLTVNQAKEIKGLKKEILVKNIEVGSILGVAVYLAFRMFILPK